VGKTVEIPSRELKGVASVVVKENEAIVISQWQTDVGVWKSMGPAYRVHPLEPEALRQKVLDAVRDSKHGVPHHRYEPFPKALTKLGFRSWKKLYLDSELLNVTIEAGRAVFFRWKKYRSISFLNSDAEMQCAANDRKLGELLLQVARSPK
jgi:hypothetical protein